MPDSLDDHWNRFVQAVRHEARAHQRDPNLVTADRKHLKVRFQTDAAPSWFSVTYTENTILQGDPHQLASDFYAAMLADQAAGE